MTRDPSERGSILVEFSLLMTTLMLLFLGTIGFSTAIKQSMTVTGAAQAGAKFGAAEGNANNTQGMKAAALNAVTQVSGMTVTPTTWCSCTAGGATVACTSTCNTYDQPIQYVQVQTSASFPAVFQFPGVPPTVVVNGNSILRAK